MKRLAYIALALLTACGGGGAGGNNEAVPSAPTPCPAGYSGAPPTCTALTTASASFTAGTTATSSQIPAVSGFAGAITLPPASNAAAFNLTASLTQPPGLVGITARSRSVSGPQGPLSLPYLYVDLSTQSNVILDGTFSLDFSLPPGLVTHTVYLAAFLNDGWYTVAGPASVAQQTVHYSFPATVHFFGGDLAFGLYDGTVLNGGPPVAAAPTSIGLMDLAASQTLQISLDDPNDRYTIDASSCSGIASVNPDGRDVYLIAAVAVGTCQMTVTDLKSYTVTVPVSVTTTNVVLQ